jgi:hypothetical protein
LVHSISIGASGSGQLSGKRLSDRKVPRSHHPFINIDIDPGALPGTDHTGLGRSDLVGLMPVEIADILGGPPRQLRMSFAQIVGQPAAEPAR